MTAYSADSRPAWSSSRASAVRTACVRTSHRSPAKRWDTVSTVPLVATRDVTLTLPHGWQNRVHVSVDYRSPVPAPVTAGQQLGEMVIANTGLAEIRIPLVAGAAVPRLGLMGRASAVLGRKLGHG